MNPALVDLERQFESVRASIESVVSGLSEEELQWRPAEGEWSIVECFDHLNAGWRVLPKLDRKIAEGRERGLLGNGRFRTKILGQLYIRIVEPPVRFRFNAPVKFRPRTSPPPSEVVPQILDLQGELIERIRAADGVDLGAITMSSPISRRFKMTIAQWFAFLAGHERRHLWQANRVRDRMSAGSSRIRA
jgi:DinB family protein